MAETLTLIHTSPVLTPVFAALCKQHLPDVAISHMVDESLIRDTIAHQRLRKLTIRRLISMIESAEAAGATAVMVTCSSIGPAAALAQKVFDIPVFRVDEAMGAASEFWRRCAPRSSRRWLCWLKKRRARAVPWNLPKDSARGPSMPFSPAIRKHTIASCPKRFSKWRRKWM
jgi:hypothetical protein